MKVLKKLWHSIPYTGAILLGLLAFPMRETYGVMAGVFLFFVAFMVVILAAVLQNIGGKQIDEREDN